MKNTIILLVFAILLTGCKDKPKEQQKVNSPEQEITTEDSSRIGLKNYAVAWKWSTTNEKLVEDNLTTIADETNKLWKNGIITDAYYDANAKIDKLSYFPNVFFFLKAKSYVEAETELNKLSLVKKGIATYSIYPVGTKWLSRDSDKINKKGITKSYAAVWTTKNLDKASDDLIKSQADAILKLSNDGEIENVYFDIKGTQKPNSVTDFVFFVNANTEEEAKELCDKLPFVNNNIASYQLYSVGVFWLGEDNRL